MSKSPCLLDWTVLDLCDETYHNPYGYFFDTIKTCDLVNVWKSIVVCLNAKTNDLSRHYDMLLEDYAPFRIQPLHLETLVEDILNLCKARELPIMAEVSELEEKCLIIAACHKPWTQWFELIFGDVDEETQSQGMKEMTPIIMPLLENLRRSGGNDTSPFDG